MFEVVESLQSNPVNVPVVATFSVGLLGLLMATRENWMVFVSSCQLLAVSWECIRGE